MIKVDDDLVRRAAAGEYRAFEEIYKLTSGYVYSVAFRVLHAKEDAEEVAQDVFVKLYKNLKGFRFKATLTTWLYRVAVNTAINQYNRVKRKRSREISDEDILDTRGVGPEAEVNMNKEDNEKKIGSLLEKLNPDQKACIILRELEGLSYEEISRAMGIKINTVKTRIKRARETLIRQASAAGGGLS